MKTSIVFNPKNKLHDSMIFKKTIKLNKNEDIICGKLNFPFSSHYNNYNSIHVCTETRNDIKQFFSLGFAFPRKNRTLRLQNLFTRDIANKYVDVGNTLVILNIVKHLNIYYLFSIRFGHVENFNQLKLKSKICSINLDYYNSDFDSCPSSKTLIYLNKNIKEIINSALNGFWNDVITTDDNTIAKINYSNTTYLDDLTFNVKNFNPKHIQDK